MDIISVFETEGGSSILSGPAIKFQYLLVAMPTQEKY